MQSLISIIIPIYNAASSIRETLDSLLEQTYRDIEIICVDDGSTDDSRNILDSYSLRDSRVRTIGQRNNGVSSARNTGLSHVSASCRIVMFVDADDRLIPQACEHVAKVFSQQRPDVFTFGLACDPPEAETASLKRDFAPPANRIYKPFAPELLYKERSRPYACRTALSYDFVKREGVRFEPGINLGEDQVFYFEVYPFSRKTVLSSKKLYLYKMNRDSATHRDRSLADRVDQHLMVLQAIIRIWKRKGFYEKRSIGGLLKWSLEFLMLDIGKLSHSEQRAAWTRYLAAMDDYTGKTEYYASTWLTKRCLQDVRKVSAGSVSTVSRGDVAAFYFINLGPTHCIERILVRLGLLK